MTKDKQTPNLLADIKVRMDAIRDHLGPEGLAVLERIEQTITEYQLTDEDLAALEAKLAGLSQKLH